MRPGPLKITYIGGPTALFEWREFRLLTDPTFDPPGDEYETGPVLLKKTAGPALAPASLGRIDIVLLSHDHHYDNLDHAGRAFLPNAERVLTTPAGAERLGGRAAGLRIWQSIDIPAPGRSTAPRDGDPRTARPGFPGPRSGDGLCDRLRGCAA